MTYVDWKIKTRRLATCSCDYGCPCEFSALPTRLPCEGVEAFEIVEGHFGDVPLNGLRVVGVYRWPGPVHEGNGIYQVVIDERATAAQRDALFTILSGGEQELTTGFNIYGSTISHEPDPIFASIEFELDLAAQRGRVEVPGVLEASLEPIRNPVTGDAQRAVIKLPNGFEFREAEMASSTFRSQGAIEQSHAGCYGFVTVVTYKPVWDRRGGELPERRLKEHSAPSGVHLQVRPFLEGLHRDERLPIA